MIPTLTGGGFVFVFVVCTSSRIWASDSDSFGVMITCKMPEQELAIIITDINTKARPFQFYLSVDGLYVELLRRLQKVHQSAKAELPIRHVLADHLAVFPLHVPATIVETPTIKAHFSQLILTFYLIVDICFRVFTRPRITEIASFFSSSILQQLRQCTSVPTERKTRSERMAADDP